jgi:hypothetical protein
VEIDNVQIDLTKEAKGEVILERRE